MYEGELADRYVNSLIREIAKWSEVDSPVSGRYDLLWRRHSFTADAGADRTDPESRP